MRPRLLVAVLLLAAGFIACSDGYDPPPSPTTVSPLLGPPKSLQVTGNLSFSFIGESRQLTASATFGGGAVRNVTSQAQWSSSNPAVATVTAGLVRVVSFGDTQITATYRGLTSEKAAVSAKASAVPATLASIAIAGPAEMAPGTTGQFTATGQYADGSSKDITSEVTWGSWDIGTLRHRAAGQFEALKAGETSVFASMQPRGATRTVLILPAGTFKLSGTVRDTSSTIDGADVEILSGNAGTSKTKTRYDGKYFFYGVVGDVRLRASAPGYASHEFNAAVSGHTISDVTLTTSSPIAEISGTWKVTASTSSACSSSWPEAARKREVTATIRQDGTQFSVNFSSPTAVATYGGSGRIAGSVFSLTLYFDYYYYYGLSGWLEKLSPTEWVRVTGTFSSNEASSSLIAGQLTGSLTYTVSSATATYPFGSSSTCAADGPFEFRR
jgi:hypothetical protein